MRKDDVSTHVLVTQHLDVYYRRHYQKITTLKRKFKQKSVSLHDTLIIKQPNYRFIPILFFRKMIPIGTIVIKFNNYKLHQIFPINRKVFFLLVVTNIQQKNAAFTFFQFY